MLKQMSKPGAALHFVARADIVVDGDRNNRSGVIFGEDDAESVLECKLRERYFERFALESTAETRLQRVRSMISC